MGNDMTSARKLGEQVSTGADPGGREPPRSLHQQVWSYVSRSPLKSLWNLEGVPARVVAKNTWNAMFADNLLGRSAELGFYFLFALFPTLFAACSVLGLAARSAFHIYENLLQYLSIVAPPAALGTVLEAFNQTTAAASSGKLTFGLVAALWSASVGFVAIQESLNVVYRVKESRPYWRARLSAIGITFILAIVVTLMLASLLAADFFARLVHRHIYHRFLAVLAAGSLRTIGWLAAMVFLSLLFALIYYFGPDVKVSQWRWLTPGSALGIVGWIVASLGLRMYVHYFNNYSATYGSLGTVIILLTWFYLSGLMLLLGGEINSEIEAAVQEKKLAAGGALKPEIVTPSTVTTPSDS
ncbi:MAG TPA: YihY/virulence factor BrkB family protein [Acidobacteriaceae bacterium]|nr:YihY/virulence factor BrkB family protein [Acidobacteriaceae bacterium]